MPEPLDPAAVMAEHERHPDGNCYSIVVSPVQFTHCKPYRLAEALAATQRDLAAEQEKVRRDAERMLALLLNPTMDVGERLVAARQVCRAALAGEGAADQPEEPCPEIM